MSFQDLICEIESKPELWNSSNPLYKHKLVKAKIWRNISMKLGLEEETLKKKWKHLKDQYRKELKKKPVSRSEAEADDWTSSWQYFDMMSFVKDEIIPAPTTGYLNTTQTTVKEETADTVTQDTEASESQASTSKDLTPFSEASVLSPEQQAQLQSQPARPNPRKRSMHALREGMLEIEKKKLSLIEKRLKERGNASFQNDEDYHFLMSLLPSIKKLTSVQKLRFRGKVNEWLLEALTLNEYSYMFH